MTYYKSGRKKQGVSIWRTLLCCNEFNELQIERYLSLEDTYIVSLFLLVYKLISTYVF